MVERGVGSVCYLIGLEVVASTFKVKRPLEFMKPFLLTAGPDMRLHGDITGVNGNIGGGYFTGPTNIIGIGFHSGVNVNTSVFTVIGSENHNGGLLTSGEKVLAGTQRFFL